MDLTFMINSTSNSNSKYLLGINVKQTARLSYPLLFMIYHSSRSGENKLNIRNEFSAKTAGYHSTFSFHVDKTIKRF